MHLGRASGHSGQEPSAEGGNCSVRGGSRPVRFRLMRFTKLRIALIFIFSTALIVAAWGRLAFVQLVKRDFYESEAMAQRYRAQPLVPERGTIFDRNGVALAMTTYGYGIYATPRLMGDPQTAAGALAPLLNTNPSRLLQQFEGASGNVWLAHRTSAATASAVELLQLPGVYVVERPQRDYPNGRLAADILGFTGVDNQGLGGIEWTFDDVLRGREGAFFSERDPRGRAIAGGRQSVVDASPGHQLVLTIDHVLQYIVEQELERGLRQAKAAWGLVVALQPRTGEILASAVLPTFDPRDIESAVPRAYRNPAVADQFEPGSTLKVFAAAAALEEGLLTLDSAVSSPAALRIGGGTVNNYNNIHHGTITLKDAVSMSSNTAFAAIGSDVVGGPTLARYLQAFGFGQRLGVDLPGEGAGNVPEPGRVAGEALRWANVAFGQGIAVTPIQLAAATAAIANGGDLMQPFVVRQVKDGAGRIVEQIEPKLLRKVISSATASDVTEAMEAVVIGGTGTRARVPGYRVAGKTGTAQIPEGGVYGDKRLASFIGFAPADDPALVLVVMLYDVQQDTAEGGRWAAPVFSAIVSRALPHLGVAPSP